MREATHLHEASRGLAILSSPDRAIMEASCHGRTRGDRRTSKAGYIYLGRTLQDDTNVRFLIASTIIGARTYRAHVT